MTIHCLFLPGSLLEVLLSIWITWYEFCDFEPCKDFGVHLKRHLAVAGTECRDKEGSLQSCPDARNPDLTGTPTSLHFCFWLHVSYVMMRKEQSLDSHFCSDATPGRQNAWGFVRGLSCSENTGLVNCMNFLPYIHTYMYINKMSVCICVCVHVYLFNAEATNMGWSGFPGYRADDAPAFAMCTVRSSMLPLLSHPLPLSFTHCLITHKI